MMADFKIAADDPRREDIRALLAVHLAFGNAHSPPEDVHALDVEELCVPEISFFSARTNDGQLLGIGALKRLDETHSEIKSMHTAQISRGRGVASAMLQHLIATARATGIDRVSLETGSMAAFEPARRIYQRAGFTYCAPFASYLDSDYSVFMTLRL